MANLLPVLASGLAWTRTDDGVRPAGATEVVAELADVARRAAAQMGAENFPVALRVLPRVARDDLAGVYRFARFVDDVGDEAPGGAQRRLLLLDAIDAQLTAVAAGEGSPIAPVAELHDLLAAGRVPVQPFRDLIEANRLDQRVSSYDTFDDLLGYCRLSATPVGRVVLHVAGAATEPNLEDSDVVCNALQVLEHCQDVREDALAGRVYLPAADLRAAGADPQALTGDLTPGAVRDVVALQVDRSEALLRAGRPLVHRLHGWARVAVAGYVAGGLATARALRAADYDVLARPIRPTKLRTAGYAVRQLGPA